MKFQLRQHFQIESARFLPKLPPTHPCSQTHGHSFKVTLLLEAEINPAIGWVIDYNEINEKFSPVLKQIDHKLLNNIPGLENPTSELLAYWIYTQTQKVLPQLKQVIIAETPLTECLYPV